MFAVKISAKVFGITTQETHQEWMVAFFDRDNPYDPNELERDFYDYLADFYSAMGYQFKSKIYKKLVDSEVYRNYKTN